MEAAKHELAEFADDCKFEHNLHISFDKWANQVLKQRLKSSAMPLLEVAQDSPYDKPCKIKNIWFKDEPMTIQLKPSDMYKIVNNVIKLGLGADYGETVLPTIRQNMLDSKVIYLHCSAPTKPASYSHLWSV